jgi:hypothetical protein
MSQAVDDAKVDISDVKSDSSTPRTPRADESVSHSPTPLLDAEPLIIPEPPVSYAKGEEKKERDGDDEIPEIPEVNIPKIPVGEKDPEGGGASVPSDPEVESKEDPEESEPSEPITLTQCNELYEKMESAKKEFKNAMKRYMEEQNLEKDLLRKYARELESENRQSSSLSLVPAVSISSSPYWNSSSYLNPSASLTYTLSYPSYNW